jgi:tRNA threonylcarbamoyladenosine biosynthesis protein TsaE
MPIVRCPRHEDTFALGERVGRAAIAGTVVALIGDLGAGKTVFARGVGSGLGVGTRVQSPTFVIVAAHEGGRLPFWHVDLYRVGAEDLPGLGLGEVLDQPGVVVVEWGDRFPDLLPSDRLEVRIDEEGSERRIRVDATGPRHAHLEGA